MSKVTTTLGLVDRDKLEVKDIVSEEPNCRILATEWYLDGELVRRDVNVNVFTGISFEGKTGEI